MLKFTADIFLQNELVMSLLQCQKFRQKTLKLSSIIPAINAFKSRPQSVFGVAVMYLAFLRAE